MLFQFAWLKGLPSFLPKPRKGVKGPLVPCGVSFPLFFPLVERKEVVEDRTRWRHGREFVSVSVGDNPSVTACGAFPLHRGAFYVGTLHI